MEAIQQSITDMMELFDTRMGEFQSNLQKASATPTVTTLAADFTSFKAFVTTALSNLQRQVELLAQQVDSSEMRERRKILLIHGVAEMKEEDTLSEVVKIFSAKLKVPNISNVDISRSHRLGRSSNGKPRPILVECKELAMKGKIWFAKKRLKDSGITISEFLTKVRHDALMMARQRFGIAKCWTHVGTVIVAGLNGDKHPVYNVADVNRLTSTFSATVATPIASSAASTTNNAPAKATAEPRSRRLAKK